MSRVSGDQIDIRLEVADGRICRCFARLLKQGSGMRAESVDKEGVLFLGRLK